jgi:hypothetical protein
MISKRARLPGDRVKSAGCSGELDRKQKNSGDIMSNWIITKRGHAVNIALSTEINYSYIEQLGGWNVRAYFPFSIEDIQEWNLLEVFQSEQEAKDYILKICR